jgi:hypothetical protein
MIITTMKFRKGNGGELDAIWKIGMGINLSIG